jgi:integrase
MNDLTPHVPLPKKKWSKTPYANLVRYIPSGTYFIHAKVHGKKVRDSLKTKSLEIAHIKLRERLELERSKPRPPADWEDWTLKDLAKEYLAGVDADYGLSDGAKKYRRETVEMIVRLWPEFENIKPRKLTREHVSKWSRLAVEHYSASRFNGMVGTFRGILALAVRKGLASENVAMEIKRMSVPLTPPELPNSKEFRELLKALDNEPQRKRSAQLVRLLAYTGMRVGAVPKVFPRNLDMVRNEFILPKHKRQKTEVRIPMIGDLRSLAKELLKDYAGDGPLFSIKNPKMALAKACKDIGIERLTPHDLRHIFATRCLESGVDVRTVAAWLDHKDGGALLLKRYAHLRSDHSHKMARRVKF